jgi:plastocyanin
MYVTLPFSNDSAVTVALGSTNPAVLNVPQNVVIPARSGSAYFIVTGLASGSAAVTGSAAIAKSGVSSSIIIGRPRLLISSSTIANAGQRLGFTVYAEDSLGTTRPVTAPVDITLTSSVPAHAAFDASLVTIPTNSSSVGAGVVFDTAGTYTITATAVGYAPSTATITANGALVVIADFSFTPQTVTIKQGQYVSWKNTGSVAHTSTSDNALWNTVIQPAQTSGVVYFGTVGSFTYHCAIHPSMTGTVVVNP